MASSMLGFVAGAAGGYNEIVQAQSKEERAQRKEESKWERQLALEELRTQNNRENQQAGFDQQNSMLEKNQEFSREQASTNRAYEEDKYQQRRGDKLEDSITSYNWATEAEKQKTQDKVDSIVSLEAQRKGRELTPEEKASVELSIMGYKKAEDTLGAEQAARNRAKAEEIFAKKTDEEKRVIRGKVKNLYPELDSTDIDRLAVDSIFNDLTQDSRAKRAKGKEEVPERTLEQHKLAYGKAKKDGKGKAFLAALGKEPGGAEVVGVLTAGDVGDTKEKPRYGDTREIDGNKEVFMGDDGWVIQRVGL